MRMQLAQEGRLSDQGPAAALQNALQTAQSQIAGANDKLGKIAGDALPVLAPLARGGADRGAVPAGPAPTPLRPSAPLAPAPSAPAKDASTDDIAKLLSGLANRSPALGGGSPLGGGGSPMGGGTPLGGQQLAKPSGEPSKLEEPKAEKKSDPKRDLAASKPDNKAAAVPAPAPVAPVPAAVGGPVEKPAATVPGKPGAKPTAPDTKVDVKGEKVTFPDAKTAKLAQLLAAADPTHPISLADAAAQAGLTPPVPGQDPGHQVAPSDAKPGDVLVAGDKKLLVLGDGKFLDFAAGKLIGADALPQDLGDKAGYFHLNDPAAGGGTGTGSVSGQTPGAVPFSVPGGGEGGPQAPVDAGAPAPVAPASVPSVGTPGVPKQGDAAVANAAATDTGLRESVPSSGVQKLDPAAVR